jgi:hypothetical protein
MIKNSLFVVMVSSWENIDIEKKIGKYRGNIVSNEKGGIVHPTAVLRTDIVYMLCLSVSKFRQRNLCTCLSSIEMRTR